MSPHGPIRLTSPSELAISLNANGSLRRIDHRDVIVNAYLGSEIEGGPANLWLRRHAEDIAWTPLLGPCSPGALHLDGAAGAGRSGLVIAGEWSGLRFRVDLVLAASTPVWLWHVRVENGSAGSETIDLVHAQDLALSDYGAVRLNEHYVSHYVDHVALEHPRCGTVLAARQNLSVGGRHPWLLLGALSRASSFCTDALQLHGLATRRGDAPIALEAARLPGLRHQHEHAMAVLQTEPVRLAPGQSATLGFFAWLVPDHPEATSAADLALVERALALPEATPPGASATLHPDVPASSHATLFSHAPFLATQPLDDDALASLCGSERRCVERDGERLLSFFARDAAHAVLPGKERASLRPHGQILRTGERLAPDEASLTTTVWMNGTFHSMLTQGHVSINRFLSTTHSYLGLFRAHGQRVFVETGDGWRLLGPPSAFEMTPSSARWWYRHREGLIEVESRAPVDRHELWLSLRVLEGEPRRTIVSHHVALNGDDGSLPVPVRWSRDERGIVVGSVPESDVGRRFPNGSFRVDPGPTTALEEIGGDERLFSDGRSRGEPFLVLVCAPSAALDFRITGQLTMPPPDDAPAATATRSAADAASAARFWRGMTGSLALRAPRGDALDALECIAPWLAHDAWIHHLAPRGLEQYSGGGWGTRDVCQGPVELLLSLGRVEPVRELLACVMRNQNADGDWPQWFMFFERERGIRPGDSHGDIVFWPLLALGQYLLASDDAGILDEVLPFFHPEGDARAERASVLGHVERALALIGRRTIPGTRLAAYGHGDWNDSMQPADAALAERLCSAWTVTLHHQMLATLAAGLRHVGRDALAARLEREREAVASDFRRQLVVDGVVVGLAHFRDDGAVEPWLHPRDAETGIHFSLLPMIHGVLADLFSTEQAREHVALVHRHLLAADGARLFDRPLPYRGGLQHRFQRAETSSFFGREIGLMYTHAHLRFAEAMAHLGDGEAFFHALRQALPIGLRDVVPGARLRQANCYSSSSDAAFSDRADASARYDAVRTGEIGFEGGWRVYSSGAGIAVRLLRERLLGLRLRRSSLGVDPVLPRALDGLEAGIELLGRPLALRYRVGPRGHGPTALVWNGEPLPFTREPSAHRTGGALVAMEALRARLRNGENELRIELG